MIYIYNTQHILDIKILVQYFNIMKYPAAHIAFARQLQGDKQHPVPAKCERAHSTGRWYIAFFPSTFN